MILAVLVSVIGTGWLADRLFSRWANDEMEPDKLLQLHGETLVTLLEEGLLSVEALQQLKDEGINIRHAVRQVDDGKSFKGVDNTESVSLFEIDDLPLPVSLRDQLLAGKELMLESNDSFHWYQRVGSGNEVLSISRSSVSEKSQSIQLVFTLLFYFCVAGLILAWVYPLVRQLRRLGAAAEFLGKGDLSRRIPTRTGSRLHDLESQFNRMAQRLQQLVEDNKLLCSAVSHDLRTPLSRLRFGIDALHEKLNVKEELSLTDRRDARRYLDRISDDLVLMEGLVSALLEFARLDQNLHSIPLAPVKLRDIIGKESSGQIHGMMKIRVELEADNDVVLGEERYARMLLRNLVENAVRFADKGVVIRLFEQAGELVLSVEDDGAGFDADNMQQLVKPFERGRQPFDETDAGYLPMTGKGYGLGLAIVERLSQWFNARLKLGSSEDLGGAKVAVHFKPHRV
ncbi:MAG: ATP-binding protein [Granulosicoccus sp.]